MNLQMLIFAVKTTDFLTILKLRRFHFWWLLGLQFGLFCSSWAPFGLPLGSLWSILGPPGIPWAYLGVLLGSLERLLGPTWSTFALLGRTRALLGVHLATS